MNDRFLRACREQSVDTLPVWFMRQAGRYQPEYRSLRKRYGLLDLVHDPELCAQVTALPVEQLGVDAAILFSDIMVPLGPLGIDYEIKEGVGPVVHHPIRTADDLDRLTPLRDDHGLEFVPVAIQKICQRLSVPLIGFSGAPFTLASYLIEGQPSRQYFATKLMMWSERQLWDRLMDVLSEMVISYAQLQASAGADAIQLFDSWAGALSLDDYNQWVRPYLERIFTALAATGVPRIYFAVGASHLLESIATLPVEVIGVDWRQPLHQVRRTTGEKILQGNLDPAVLAAPWDAVADQARAVIRDGRGGGHIFNLGHGVPPQTDPDRLRQLVELIHSEGSRH